MIWFDGQLLNLLDNANITISFYKRYVDDGNLKLPAIEEGLVWNTESKTLKKIVCPSGASELPDKRTALIIKDIADSVTGMLKWTADFPSAHTNDRLPILDIETWCTETQEGTVVNYSFYKKPMANDVAIPSNSAISSSVKFHTYREETKRVLRNTSRHLPWSHKANLLTELSYRMKRSGYSASFRSKIISEGLRGHMKKVVSTHKQGMPFNRSGDVIRKSKSHRCKTSNNWFRNSGGSVQFDTVLFVPATSGSKLATILKNHEAQNVQGRRSRIKVVERSGKCVKDLLSKSYPWPTDRCSDTGCFPCSTGKKGAFFM